jgi:hypothetical protein
MRRAAAVLFLLVLSAVSWVWAAEPFRDPKLPLEARVNSLVSLLTLDEKIAMLGQTTPAIARLNVKSFTNFTEGLHGIGWDRGGNLTATQFPQSVGLGEPSGTTNYSPVPLLVMMTEETGDPGYQRAAVRAAEYVWASWGRRGLFVGGASDNPNITD